MILCSYIIFITQDCDTKKEQCKCLFIIRVKAGECNAGRKY